MKTKFCFCNDNNVVSSTRNIRGFGRRAGGRARAARACLNGRRVVGYGPRREGRKEGEGDSATSLEFQPGVFKTIVLTQSVCPPSLRRFLSLTPPSVFAFAFFVSSCLSEPAARRAVFCKLAS